MKTSWVSIFLMGVVMPVQATDVPSTDCPAALNFSVKELAGGKQVNLCKAYLGKVILVVNTASKCGFTPQYEGLEALYGKYQERGLVVIGFPSNDFGQQEPGAEEKIKEFCKLTYGVKFPMYSKTKVRQDHADPLYQTLGTLANQFPQWNFHKYLIDRKGMVVASFESKIEPQSDIVVKAIEKLL